MGRLMNSVHVYLRRPHQQTADDMRLEHIARTVDKDLVEVRVYTLGEDFFNVDIPEGRMLPYGMIDGKPKSNDNFFNEIVGDKIED